MNVQLPVHLDKQAFLAWVQEHEERYELVDGRVVMMVGASRNHGLLVLNIAVLLRNQLDPRTVIADFGLDAGPRTLRYPDVMVDRAGGDYTTSDPLLLIEVLSPSSEALDLAAYIVFAQREAKAWVWLRTNAGFSSGPDVIAGREEIVRIPTLSVSLPFSDVYQGIALD
jgi:Uma2 family endonuclease